MPVFEYEIVDSSGTIGRGRQQAEDQAELSKKCPRLMGRAQCAPNPKRLDIAASCLKESSVSSPHFRKTELPIPDRWEDRHSRCSSGRWS